MDPVERKVSSLYAFVGVDLSKNNSSILYQGRERIRVLIHINNLMRIESNTRHRGSRYT
jgi:hypothetical protein